MARSSSDTGTVENLEGFLSVLRHRLGNSVNALKVTVDVLQENLERFDPQKIEGYVVRTRKIVSKQMELVEALKSFSSFTSGKGEIDFLAFWKRFVSTASNRTNKDEIVFEHRIDVHPCSVIGQEAALHKVMFEIFENAADAVEGKKDAWIQISARRSGNSVVIVTRDNGRGIREKDLSKIYLPLFSTKPDRMGMGLPIARKILREMNGRIQLRSSHMKGTEAKVWVKTAGA